MTTPVVTGQGQQKPTSPINQAKQVFQPNPNTREKAEGAKAYIEKKYAKLKDEEKEKKDAWDKLIKQMDKMNLSPTEKDLIKQEIQHKEAELLRLSRVKITVKDFDPLKIIGRGAFGEVRVCRNRKSQEVVAIKKMKKTEMIYKNQVAHVRAERDILALAKNPWIVELKCSFQDERFLYLVMEFLQGGDLMTLLMEKDIFTEEESRFYIAETILAVETVHSLNYIHRDLKPDNLLIGKDGHVKLSDFGLCKHVEIKPRATNEKLKNDLSNIQDEYSKNPNMNKQLLKTRMEYKRTRQLAYSTVGTPDYIAPEVFGQCGYNETVDWWSVGAILFEMLVGYPPFFSDDPSVTCQKILHWKKTLNIPPEANLSPAATDILKRLLCDADHRLGANGVEEIKAHPFFEDLDWVKMRQMQSPYAPELTSDDDCRRFDKFEEEEPFHPVADDKKNLKKQRKDVNFPGYTYKKDVEEQKNNFVRALNESLQTDITGGNTSQNNISYDNSGSSGMAGSNIGGGVSGGVGTGASSIGMTSNVHTGGSTPNQQQKDLSQNTTSSNYYTPMQQNMMNSSQQHNDQLTMLSNSNISKNSQMQQHQIHMMQQQQVMPNLKKQQQQMHQYNDDDDQPSEESKGKIQMQMANTGYDGFGNVSGAGGPQMKGYYQQQQQQMSSSHYVQKGVGMTTQQQQMLLQQQQQQQKLAMAQQQRQPPPDIYVKTSALGNKQMPPSSQANMMGGGQGYGQGQLTKEQQLILMQQLQKKNQLTQQQQMLSVQQQQQLQQQQLAQQKMMMKMGAQGGVSGNGMMTQQQKQPQMQSQQQKYMMPSSAQTRNNDQYDGGSSIENKKSMLRD